ncbi:MAG: hypothetical protein AAF467_26825 [Actinomycetota bacterium]
MSSIEAVRAANRNYVNANRASTLMVHAAVATSRGRCVVLPGWGEAGKSTLVAGLVRAGWRYGSDELAVFSLDGELEPYARPISIDVGAYGLFPELLDKGYRTDAEQWHVRPDHVAPDPLGLLPEPTHVLFPLYEPNAPTVVEPISPAHALHRLIGHAVNLGDHPRFGFQRLAQLAERCQTATMRSGDLNEQIAAIEEWMFT